jgi:predicted nucleic acid-binding protein
VQKIYIDTNILISYISGPEKEPNQFPKAKQIFDDIKQGKFIGVISTLTLIEIKGVLRTILGSDRTQLQIIPENKQADHVKTKATEIFQVLISELLQLSNIKFEKGIDFSLIAEDEKIRKSIFIRISGHDGYLLPRLLPYQAKQVLDTMKEKLHLHLSPASALVYEEAFGQSPP